MQSAAAQDLPVHLPAACGCQRSSLPKRVNDELMVCSPEQNRAEAQNWGLVRSARNQNVCHRKGPAGRHGQRCLWLNAGKAP